MNALENAILAGPRSVQNNSKHPGALHFEMEPAGGSSRWNTLRAARVLAAYGGNGI
jgi:hypothetical protein